MRKVEIFCTIGPTSLNKKFLKNIKNIVSMLRINLSHTSIVELKKTINFIRKHTNIPICIDTDGRQLRTRSNKRYYFKKKQKFKLSEKNSKLKIYPPNSIRFLKIRDTLKFGFSNLEGEIISKKNSCIVVKATSSGFFETNKGISVNRNLNTYPLTKKDLICIKTAQKMKIRNFALSFTNSINDILIFNKLLSKEKKFFKLETRSALKNINSIMKKEKNFLIDRGDLSKEIGSKRLHYAQKKIIDVSKKFNGRKVYVATGFLDSMMKRKKPSAAEISDIIASLQMGAAGIVLAAETAIGKFPFETLAVLKKHIDFYHSI